MASAKRAQSRFPIPRRANRTHSAIIETFDSSAAQIPSSFLTAGQQPRDPNSQLARLAQQFAEQNRARLRLLDADLHSTYDGTSVCLQVTTHSEVGAVSLVSPTTGRNEYGLVIKPRFGWPGIGPILGASGWRVAPSLLNTPSLPRSERKIPPWVLAVIVIFRMRALVQNLDRKFEMTAGERSAPRGSVAWEEYARRKISCARMLEVPCRFPNLQEDRELKGAIRFTLEKQLGSLEGQRTAGAFVLDLIVLCQQLLNRVRDTPPMPPRAATLALWMRRTLRTEIFRRGVEAIEWTVDERGLAGLSDLQGLPWSMSMESFFEAWVETIMARVARQSGGLIRTGRQKQTVVPLGWDPRYLGSQKSLIPDVVLEREDLTVIVDAKYKDHWEEMQDRRWTNLDEELRERHRGDLLQVLAYSTIARTSRVLVCLAYPCREETWQWLRERGRLFHRASIPTAERRINLLLTAFPLSTRALEDVTKETSRQISIVN